MINIILKKPYQFLKYLPFPPAGVRRPRSIGQFIKLLFLLKMMFLTLKLGFERLGMIQPIENYDYSRKNIFLIQIFMGKKNFFAKIII